MHSTIRQFSWMIGLCWLAFSAPAKAQTEAEPSGYRQAVDQAIAEFSRRNFEEARALFARADGLMSSARTQRGIGLADFELHDYIECIKHLQNALDSQVRPLQGEMRTDAEQLLARAQAFVGRFVIQTDPASAKLVLDGYSRQLDSNHVLWLKPGEHALELEAPTYTTERHRLTVRGGEQEQLHFKLTPAPKVEAPTQWWESPWFWGGAGVVAASAAVIVISVVIANRETPAPKADPGSSGVVLGALSFDLR